jgi:hypothetical protein
VDAHRIKAPIVVTVDGSHAVALPTYWDLAYTDGGRAAYVTVPVEDCPCRHDADGPDAWSDHILAKYGPPQRVAAWAARHAIEHGVTVARAGRVAMLGEPDVEDGPRAGVALDVEGDASR